MTAERVRRLVLWFVGRAVVLWLVVVLLMVLVPSTRVWAVGVYVLAMLANLGYMAVRIPRRDQHPGSVPNGERR